MMNIENPLPQHSLEDTLAEAASYERQLAEFYEKVMNYEEYETRLLAAHLQREHRLHAQRLEELACEIPEARDLSTPIVG